MPLFSAKTETPKDIQTKGQDTQLLALDEWTIESWAAFPQKDSQQSTPIHATPLARKFRRHNRTCFGPKFLFQDSNLRNVSATTAPSAQFCPEQLPRAPMLRPVASMITMMTTIVLVGVAGFLVVLAIILKARAAHRKKPEKWEKAQIVKRLIALSEREDIVNRISRQQTVSQSQTSRCRAAAAGTSASRTVRSA